MSRTYKRHLTLVYEHEGVVRKAFADVGRIRACITFAGVPSLKMQVSFRDPEQVVVYLPTDRKDRTPTVVCELSSVPELQDALNELAWQLWLMPRFMPDG